MAEEKREILRLYSGDGYGEVPMEQIGRILPKPRVIKVPGAPDGIAGMVYFHGRLIAVKYLDGAQHKEEFECAVLVVREDGSLCGLLADDLSGGERFDSIYG